MNLVHGPFAAWVLTLSLAATAALAVVVLAARGETARRRRRAAVDIAKAWPLVLAITDGAFVAPPADPRVARALGLRVALLAHQLRGDDRENVAAWLTRNGYREVAEAQMRSRRAAVRARGLELYLASVGSEPPERAVDLLSDRDARVRVAAVRAIGASGSTAHIPELIHAVSSRRRPVPPGAVLMAVVNAAPRSADVLRPGFQSADSRAVLLTIEAAHRLGLADAALDVQRVASRAAVRSDVALSARRALEAFGREDLLRALAQADPRRPGAPGVSGEA